VTSPATVAPSILILVIVPVVTVGEDFIVVFIVSESSEQLKVKSAAIIAKALIWIIFFI